MKTLAVFNDGSLFTTTTSGICLERKIERWARDRHTSLSYRESWNESWMDDDTKRYFEFAKTNKFEIEFLKKELGRV